MLLCLHICHASFPYIFHRDRVFHIQKFSMIQTYLHRLYISYTQSQILYAIIRRVRNDTDAHKQVQCRRPGRGLTCNSISMPLSQTGSYTKSDMMPIFQTWSYM